MAETSTKLGVIEQLSSPPADGPGLPHHVSVMAIVLAGLLAHGVLLLTDYRLWDGWEYSLWLSDEAQTGFLYRLFNEIGRPLDRLFWLPFEGLENPHLVAKAAGVTAWITHVVLMYECIRRPQFLGDSLGLVVALLTVTCPVFRPLGELSIWMNTAAVTLFWAGCYLLVRMSECVERRWRLLARAVAASLLFVSFNLNSQIVYLYGLIASALLCVFIRRPKWLSLHQIVTLGLRFPDVLALPVVFWLWKSWFTPAHSAYTGYNQPSISPAVLTNGYWTLLSHLLFPLFKAPLQHPEFAVASVIGATLAVRLARRIQDAHGLHSFHALPLDPIRHGTVAILLLAFASFAYISVGQFVADDPWLGRNNILTPLALSLGVACAAVAMSQATFPQRRQFGVTACIAVCCLWVALSNLGYLQLQAFGLKQLAIRKHVREVIRAHAPSVIQLHDAAPLEGGIAHYPPLIWTTMAACCKETPRTLVLQTPLVAMQTPIPIGDETPAAGMWFSIQTSEEMKNLLEQTTVPYALKAIPTVGPQVGLTVQRPQNPTQSHTIGATYLISRWSAGDTASAMIDDFCAAYVKRLNPVLQDDSVP